MQGEILSALADSNVLDVALGTPVTALKNALALAEGVVDVAKGTTNTRSYGLAYFPEAQGQRIRLDAVALTGQNLTWYQRAYNTVTIHGMPYVAAALQQQSGWKPPTPAMK